jgi:hypothetical protein
MRRRVLHIVAASLALTVGSLTADSYRNLTYALTLSILAFFLTMTLPRMEELDPHFWMVVAVSLLLWVAGVAALF